MKERLRNWNEYKNIPTFYRGKEGGFVIILKDLIIERIKD
jgi:hypothetical protein